MFLYECVPNVSCGRDSTIIAKFSQLLQSFKGCRLLHVDSGHDADRSVFTLVGQPEGLLEAMKAFYRFALELVDMHEYNGNHPAIGAIDVCPFVPLYPEASMEVCKSLALELARYVAQSFEIPVYLYRESATSTLRQELANIRRGGLAGLSRRISEEAWKPDFGPAQLHTSFGATIIGARPLLIAFNIDLNSNDLNLAKRIAAQIRESSSSPHALPYCRSLGWKLQSIGLVQISNNLYNYEITGLHTVYEKVRELAFDEGGLISGSEVVGLVPVQALLNAGNYFLNNTALENFSTQQICEIAIKALGLRERSSFCIEDRVIEFLYPRY